MISDNWRELVQQQINSAFINNSTEPEEISLLTEWLSHYAQSDFNLDDLKEFLQQQELVKSVVTNLN